MSTHVSIHVGPKNRVVLPLALRQAAGIEVGSELVGHVDAQGRLILETVTAARDRVWSGAPTSEGDSTEDVRDARLEDQGIEASSAVRRAASTGSDQAAHRLLEALGL